MNTLTSPGPDALVRGLIIRSGLIVLGGANEWDRTALAVLIAQATHSAYIHSAAEHPAEAVVNYAMPHELAVAPQDLKYLAARQGADIARVRKLIEAIFRNGTEVVVLTPLHQVAPNHECFHDLREMVEQHPGKCLLAVENGPPEWSVPGGVARIDLSF